tara:strand:+ start:489 stop:779 length:291 start_codon:yes stop_codon:yes gene_type:complete
MSEYEERVIAEITHRAERGLNKYGVSMERDDLSVAEWLQHAKEEALDLSIYLERLIDTAQEIIKIKEYVSDLRELAAESLDRSAILRELAQMIEDL